MCGITGLAPSNPELLEKMNLDLAHRGPDWTGRFGDERISIGHTLLAIRGLVEASKQPVTNAEWVLAFNGQLYNTRELDTQFLFQQIEKHGWDFVNHIRGMFAIALYNRKEGVIRLYRDPSGQKVLYYHQHGNKFVFASEIESLLESGIERKADREAILAATSLGYIPGDKTMIAGVKKVRPSECVSFDLKTSTLTRTFFKQIDKNYFSPDPKAAFRELVEEHLQSKVPISINLSGGLDSSLLLHEMKGLDHEIHSYSTSFEGGGEKLNRDAVYAKRLAQDYGALHQEIVITKENFWKTFRESYDLIEEPNYNISNPVYLLTAKREGVHSDGKRVVLTGDGGDEIFGGYPHYAESLRLHQFERILSSAVFSFLKNKRSGTDFNFGDADERWLFFKNFNQNFSKENNLEILKDYTKATTKDWIEIYGKKKGPVYDLMLRDRVLWLAGENFIRTDKLYMSESLEMRAPLSYSPFRAYIDELIPNSKYVGLTNKVFLRELYRGRLPDYIVDRKDKTGWRAPVSIWYDAEAKKMFLEILNSQYLTGSLVDWPRVREHVIQSEGWPGKIIHLYLSLAIIAQKYKIEI